MLSLKLLCLSVVTDSVAFAGDDSSNEDQGEERAEGDEENKEMKRENKAEGDDGASREQVAVPEEPEGEQGGKRSNMEAEAGDGREEDSGKEKVTEDGESEEFSFPDTTISLTHLQPSR